MQAGKLDQQIGLIQSTETNLNGELTVTYAAAISVWGNVLTARGNEAFEAARTNARETVRVAIRYRDDVNATWRLTWNGQTYNILNVDRSARREGMLWLTGEAKGAV